MSFPDDLEQAIGDWFLRKETTPSLLPGEFARELPESMRSAFLRELELIAEIDALATAAPSRDLPRRYGDFRVLGEIGRGAMGAVHDAEQVSSGRRVALKVMHPHIARDLQSAARFRREARTAASLVHPGIVPVLGFGETDGAAWLAMARVEGRSLQRLLAAHADPRDMDHPRAAALFSDPRRLASALAEAADALEFAHRHNVVHRDVKPANLMCTDDGRMVVLDFGLASARDQDAEALTRTGDFLGTPLYMAPEQAKGAENGTPRSDVYALGAVLYECLCGRTPVPPGPLATVIDAILNRDPVLPRSLRQSVPEELSRIAMQCLEKDPARRYATAAALADDLRRFVDGSSVHARSSGIVHRSWRKLRRRPALTTLAISVVLLVPAVAITALFASRTNDRAAVLQHEADLQRVDELLGTAPERLTVFGGASHRFYARLGLGDQLADRAPRSPRAATALQLAQDLAAKFPEDVNALRTHARARLDVGDDAKATDAAIATLLTHPAATAADRMMAAVWARQNGQTANDALPLPLDAQDDPQVAFWRGFWHQDEQDHHQAIAAFTQALAWPDLATEQRYQALLHRGWCRTCPDVAELDVAMEDLLQAAALRPRYGTARLLWAALKCLQAQSADELGAPVQAVNEVLEHAEPWVHVLTARVLCALAEAGTTQSGPVAFGGEFSPIAALPVQPGFADAFADIACKLLDGVIKKEPSSFEAAFHRIGALALRGKHADALAEANRLMLIMPSRTAAIELQRARVHLAAGRAQRAFESIDKALTADPRFVAAWRCQALIAGHVGDRERQLHALERAAFCLAECRREPSVFPDAAAALPELQLERARLLLHIGRRDEAMEVLRDGDFGGALAGERSPRVVLQRNALLRTAGGEPLATPIASVPANSPLRWLQRPAAPLPTALDAAARTARAHGWLSAVATAVAIDDIEKAPLRSLFANAPALLASEPDAARVLARCDALLAQDPQHGDARLLRALVLFQTSRTTDAAAFLAATLDEHPDDLRSRYLLAAAAKLADDPALLRLACKRGRVLLSAAELDRAAAALPFPMSIGGAELLGSLR